MDGYTKAERARITEQARCDHGAIRCPLDEAAMQLTHTVAARVVRDRLVYREFDGLPAGSEWTVKYLDVTCPTCGQSALMISLEVQAS